MSDWIAYRQHKLTYSSEGWEVQDQAAGTFSTWWRCIFCFTDGHLFHVLTWHMR